MDVHSARPPEHPLGQDDGPDLYQLLRVLRKELRDLVNDGPPDADQLLRLRALLAVIRRVLGDD